jgi:hypothetical protein
LLVQIDNDDLAVSVKTNEIEMKGLNSKLESAQKKYPTTRCILL